MLQADFGLFCGVWPWFAGWELFKFLLMDRDQDGEDRLNFLQKGRVLSLMRRFSETLDGGRIRPDFPGGGGGRPKNRLYVYVYDTRRIDA